MIYPTLTTPRLILRPWRQTDRVPFAAMNADRAVMAHFPNLLDRPSSDALADRIERHFAEHGFGLWAVEIPGVTAFAGFIGLNVPAFQAEFTPCVEIGWRLARPHWGQGYAFEGAAAALVHGFEAAALDQILSWTTPGNVRSWRLMERLGLRRIGSFDHPSLAESDRLRRHLLYRITRDQWTSRR